MSTTNNIPLSKWPAPSPKAVPAKQLFDLQDDVFTDIYFPNLHRDLEMLKTLWVAAQSTRNRVAIYPFLEGVFDLVTLSQRKNRSKRLTKTVVKLSPSFINTQNPFAAVIHCVVPAGQIDSRTRSKWANALIFSQQHKISSESLQSFMLRHGGINECAGLFRKRG